jgi:hypothetical protein
MHISGNVAHTVDFMQGAITIIFALALGEALKLFVSGHEDSPLLWDRLPALLAFLFVFFPFFQSMSQYLYLTYLNEATAPPFRSGFLIFDGSMYILEATCFYLMSRALAPKHWRHFYGAVLTLMAIDIVWTGVTWRRGMAVGAWLWIDIAIVVVLGGTMIYARDKHWHEAGRYMLPSWILVVTLGITTALSYWLESGIYFPGGG